MPMLNAEELDAFKRAAQTKREQYEEERRYHSSTVGAALIDRANAMKGTTK